MTRFDRNELSLNLNLPGDPRDTSTPEAYLATMQKILLGDALRPASRERILAAMKRSHTGDRRRRAGLPRDWEFAGKTGTGGRCTVNHVAVVWPPNRRPILIVSYLSESETSGLGILERRKAAALARRGGKRSAARNAYDVWVELYPWKGGYQVKAARMRTLTALAGLRRGMMTWFQVLPTHLVEHLPALELRAVA